MSSSCLPELLTRVNFPLYNVGVLSPRHIIVGGGGVKNGFVRIYEIFELSHNGRNTEAESVCRHETGEFAVMNLTTGRYKEADQSNVVAVGQDDKCQTFRVQMTRQKISQPNGATKQNGPQSSVQTRLIFKVTALKSVQTDFNMPEPYQKVCRISPDGSLLATGGDDGFLRIWTFPDLFRAHEVEAHEKEIDDLDFSPDNAKILTVSKDRSATVWDARKGKKHAVLGWDPPGSAKYMFKRARFARVEGSNKNYKIFSISNPVGASKPPSYLQRFDGKTCLMEQLVSFSGSLSALAVSDNGHYVATGSMFDGTIEIFVAFNLQRLKRVEKAHSTFVTGLEFLPSGESSDVIRGFNDCSVVSISVDHQICIHHVPQMRKMSMVLAFFIMAGILICVFILCSYLGL
eukprot:TCALIF_05750-PA protein Name:"Similar to Preb Prolactin regulatory element-binding protein (Mus musculus)" AED:0.03 eAED:0.03 QI:109/1/1/1/0.6/0.66/6/232/402